MPDLELPSPVGYSIISRSVSAVERRPSNGPAKYCGNVEVMFGWISFAQ